MFPAFLQDILAPIHRFLRTRPGPRIHPEAHTVLAWARSLIVPLEGELIGDTGLTMIAPNERTCCWPEWHHYGVYDHVASNIAGAQRAAYSCTQRGVAIVTRSARMRADSTKLVVGLGMPRFDIWPSPSVISQHCLLMHHGRARSPLLCIAVVFIDPAIIERLLPARDGGQALWYLTPSSSEEPSPSLQVPAPTASSCTHTRSWRSIRCSSTSRSASVPHSKPSCAISDRKLSGGPTQCCDRPTC